MVKKFPSDKLNVTKNALVTKSMDSLNLKRQNSFQN